MFFRLATLVNLLRKKKKKSTGCSGTLIIEFNLGSYACRFINLSVQELQQAFEEIQAGSVAGIWNWQSRLRTLGMPSPWQFQVSIEVNIHATQLALRLQVNGESKIVASPESCRDVFESLASEMLVSIGRPVNENCITCQLKCGNGGSYTQPIHPRGATSSLAMA